MSSYLISAYSRHSTSGCNGYELFLERFRAAAHGMYPGPGMGARVAFEDAHQLALLLHEAFSSPTPATAVPAAIKR